MTNERVKELLSGVREGDEPSVEDAEVMEALEIASGDESLTAWLEGDRAFDVAFRDKLREVPVPAELEGLLLEQAAKSGSKVVPFYARRAWMAAAAVVMLAAVLVKTFVFPVPVEFPEGNYASAETFREHMAYFAGERFLLDESTDDLDEARTWLANRAVPVFSKVPVAMAGSEGIGCKEINWRGVKVGLVCFRNDGGEIVHLFMAERGQFEGELELLAGTSHGLETAGWSDEKYVYVLVGSEPGVEVSEFLPATA